MLIAMEKLKMSWKDDLWIGLMLQVQWCTHTCGYIQGIPVLYLFTDHMTERYVQSTLISDHCASSTNDSLFWQWYWGQILDMSRPWPTHSLVWVNTKHTGPEYP